MSIALPDGADIVQVVSSRPQLVQSALVHGLSYHSRDNAQLPVLHGWAMSCSLMKTISATKTTRSHLAHLRCTIPSPALPPLNRQVIVLCTPSRDSTTR